MIARMPIAAAIGCVIAFSAETTALGQGLTPLASITTEVNLLAPDQGGQAILVPNDGWMMPVTAKADTGAWVHVGEDAIYAFKDEKPAIFSQFGVLITGASGNNIKQVELLVANDWHGPFRSLGKFTTINSRVVKTPYQEFAFPVTTARYLKVRIMADWANGSDVWLVPAAFRVTGHMAN
jgi:hypothetical protein